jgi:predicted nucleic acid-binding protein
MGCGQWCHRGYHHQVLIVVDTDVFLGEYEDVLGRSTLLASSRLRLAEREELLDIFIASCRWTRIYFGWRPNLRDEGDNHLVELAVAGGADVIVTHNIRHLRAMELKFPGLTVATPAQLLSKERTP